MLISVLVTTGAKKETVEVVSPTRLKILVKQKAERNMANKRVLELVAAHFKIPKTRARLIKGHTTPAKIFEVQ